MRLNHYRLHCRAAAVALAMSLAIAQPVQAATGQDRFTEMNEQVRTGVRGIRTLDVSPDGKAVLAAITDTTAEGGHPRLWLLKPGEKGKQLTFRTGDKGEMNGAFSADGQRFFFLAEQNGSAAIFRQSLSDDEPERLVFNKSGEGPAAAQWGGPAPTSSVAVGGFKLSPDGKYIAFWADDPVSAETKGKIERRDDAYVHGAPDNRTHLYLLDLQNDKIRAVSLSGPFRAAQWSQGSADLIIVTGEPPFETGPDFKYWRMSPPTGQLQQLELPRSASSIALMPDGQHLVYTDRCAEDSPMVCYDLYVRDLSGSVTRNLSKGLKANLPIDFIVTSNDMVAMTIAQGFRTRIATVSTSTGEIRWQDAEQPVATKLTTNTARTGWAYIAESATQPPTVMLTSALGAKASSLQAPAMVPADWPKVPSRLIKWNNEGLTIEGALYLPVMRKGAKVPLVVVVHGGPADHFHDGYWHLTQLLVAQGWAVLQPNIRGSDGYGAAFMAAVKGDMGGVDLRDILTGVDAVLKDHAVDSDRMALIGYSYGGEMAAFAAGRTDRFKAIVSGSPVINQFSEYGTERNPYYDYWYLGHPWVNFESAWKQSPLSTAASVKTPFLLFQAEKDETDPLGQSLEMYRAVLHSGGDTALVVYPRENHAQTGENFRARVSDEPWHGVDLRRRVFGFLRAAFEGKQDPLAAAREQR